MAARKYKLSATTTAQTFGELVTGKKRDFIFQNLTSSANSVWIDCNGNTAVADIGFVLELQRGLQPHLYFNSSSYTQIVTKLTVMDSQNILVVQDLLVNYLGMSNF